MSRIVGTSLVAVLLLCMLVGAAQAEPEFSRPVYSPDSKSYFQLVKIGRGYSIRGMNDAIGWEAARKFAQTRVYKGIPGRLAVVKSKAVNTFLREAFKPSTPVWIGLRYWCNFRVLQWVTGERLKPADYQNWDSKWSSGGGHRGSAEPAKCQSEPDHYMPVNYWPVQEGFRWNANGMHKEFQLLFIEFPTGGK